MIDVRLSGDDLDLSTCYDFVQDPACGGIALFVGAIRNHNQGEEVTHLEFSSYDGMALKEMRKIAEAASEDYGLAKVALHHRKGELKIGDVAVIIAVSSPHRKAAFEGCAYVIDELKKHVPIWKKEFRADGTHWLNARP
ncbi:molybdenum cofactor biosynthesis protein MoaE [Neolewinella antarctica]|uniref:Molybdopterin synthase catalytic subunit n=1 Tax=Neolewinella antarctica TaxID=442734 RepID=A0ABX0X752_9BACT|nr:molybdenum cofactor biosynthesis protein MoaE [Neolewinella antarctica]NJC24967.1 molybdopterin synthase catalytic subunit [Neolewinella antarctica]